MEKKVGLDILCELINAFDIRHIGCEVKLTAVHSTLSDLRDCTIRTKWYSQGQNTIRGI